MQFIVIEHFRDGNPRPAYRRFAEEGRHCPDGMEVLNSWVDVGFSRCFMLIESDDAALIQKWSAAWADLVHIEIVPVTSSKEAAQALGPFLADAQD